MKSAIIIMAKVPSAGNVKTRLQPFLAPDECAALAGAFLQDAVNKTKNICENIILAFSPLEEINVLRRLLPSQNIFVEQRGRVLGDRMFNAFEFACSQDSDSILMIGTDSPTIPIDFFEQAFEFLKTKNTAVLGKTGDGGFYLIGFRKMELKKEIFENVEWSSPETFRQTAGNITKSGLNLKQIPVWYDVDEPGDLERLARELRENETAKKIAPQTFEWVKKNYNSR